MAGTLKNTFSLAFQVQLQTVCETSTSNTVFFSLTTKTPKCESKCFCNPRRGCAYEQMHTQFAVPAERISWQRGVPSPANTARDRPCPRIKSRCGTWEGVEASPGRVLSKGGPHPPSLCCREQRGDTAPAGPWVWAATLKCQPFQMSQKWTLQVLLLCPPSCLTDLLPQSLDPSCLCLHPSVVPSSQIHKPRYWPSIPKHSIFRQYHRSPRASQSINAFAFVSTSHNRYSKDLTSLENMHMSMKVILVITHV